ncbi:MAG: hypothetical protein KGN34_04095 [Sphingomonadales bacterium]|nr:hypothetical protein [Sphingomonadales bacterium]
MAPDNVLILDELVVRPGQAAAVRAHYRADYVPAAERRGMVLQAAWQSPPGPDLPGVETTLWFVWRVHGVAGWWRQRFSRLPDGSDERAAKQAFWQGLEPLLVSRQRRMLSAQEQG